MLADYQDPVRREFQRLLAKEGRELDPLGREIWMPHETRYTELFNGKLLRVLVAEPEAVLVSKALKAPAKNGPLITEYIASGPSPRFFELATKYAVNLAVHMTAISRFRLVPNAGWRCSSAEGVTRGTSA